MLLLLSAWWMRQRRSAYVDLSRAYFGTDTRGQGLIAGSCWPCFLWQDRCDDGKWAGRGSWMALVALGGLVAMMFLFTDQGRAVYTNFGFLLSWSPWAPARVRVRPGRRGAAGVDLRQPGVPPLRDRLVSVLPVALAGHRLPEPPARGLEPGGVEAPAVAVALVAGRADVLVLEQAHLHAAQCAFGSRGSCSPVGFATAAMALLLATSGVRSGQPAADGGQRDRHLWGAQGGSDGRWSWATRWRGSSGGGAQGLPVPGGGRLPGPLRHHRRPDLHRLGRRGGRPQLPEWPQRWAAAVKPAARTPSS